MNMAKIKITYLIRAVSTIHDIDVDKYLIEVEFRTVEGQLKRTTLARGLAPSKALEKLLNEGATLPGATAAALSEVLRAEPDRLRRVTGRTGWHGSSFVLPDVTIGPDAMLGYREGSRGEEHARGTLDDWRGALALPCLASSYLTFGIGSAFAGPLLQLISICAGSRRRARRFRSWAGNR
jgi:putative DNA primase/helicase